MLSCFPYCNSILLNTLISIRLYLWTHSHTYVYILIYIYMHTYIYGLHGSLLYLRSFETAPRLELGLSEVSLTKSGIWCWLSAKTSGEAISSNISMGSSMWPELHHNMAAGCQVTSLEVTQHHFQCITFLEAATKSCSISRGKWNRIHL